MKSCINCGDSTPNNHAKYCSDCSELVNKIRILKNQIKFNDLMIEAKSKPCEECGETYPYFVMNFIGSQKMSKFKKGTYSIKNFKEALSKSKVLCSNCGRREVNEKV